MNTEYVLGKIVGRTIVMKLFVNPQKVIAIIKLVVFKNYNLEIGADISDSGISNASTNWLQ